MTAHRLAQRALVAVVLGAVVAIGVVLLAASGSGPPAGRPGLAGPQLPAGVRAVSFTLTDQNGRAVRSGSFPGRVLVVAFIHSKCTGICPFTAEDIRGALDQLPPATAARVVPLAVTVAPAEDTAASRRAFLSTHHLTGRLAYLNGPRAVLTRVWGGYHVLPEPPHGVTDAHSTFTFIVDVRGYVRVGYPDAAMTPEKLAGDIALLATQR